MAGSAAFVKVLDHVSQIDSCQYLTIFRELFEKKLYKPWVFCTYSGDDAGKRTHWIPT